MEREQDLIIKNMLTRRSIRSFKSEVIKKKDVIILLKAAMSALSGGNGQSWRFIVIDKKNLLRFSKGDGQEKMLANIPFAILVCGDSFKEKWKGIFSQDAAAASQNILLAAHALKLGAVWLLIHSDKGRERRIKRICKIPKNIELFSLIAIGYPDIKKYPVDRFDADKIRYNTWENFY